MHMCPYILYIIHWCQLGVKHKKRLHHREQVCVCVCCEATFENALNHDSDVELITFASK